MEFIQHTFNWTKGEIFEATLVAVSGIALVVCGVLFWKIGATPNAKAMLIPLVLVGTLFVGMGIGGAINNKKRLVDFEYEYELNPKEFVKAEKERVEGFQYLYTMTIIMAAVCFSLAVLIFLFSNSAILKAVAIALLIVGLSGIVIDHFSKERADIYYEQILVHQD